MISAIIRFIVSAVVLMLVSWLLPGVSVNGFVGAIIAAVVIAVLGEVVAGVLGEKRSPKSRGLAGFISAAVVIYLTQLIVPNQFSVSILGALLAALVIGFVDAIVPTELR